MGEVPNGQNTHGRWIENKNKNCFFYNEMCFFYNEICSKICFFQNEAYEIRNFFQFASGQW